MTLDWGCRWVFLIATPAMLALIVLGEPIVTAIYHYGKFTDADVSFVYLSLVAFVIGLVPIMMVKVLAPGFYARKDTRTPVRIGVMSMIVNIVFSVLLFKPFAHVGLATATSIAALVNATALFVVLLREQVFVIQPGWIKFGLQLGLASAAMTSLLLWWTPPLDFWLQANAWQRIIRLMVLVISGAFCYGLALLILGLRPRHLILKT